MQKHIVLIQCQDAKGLIHKITSVLLWREFNIIRNSEFVDPDSNTFFMRSEVEGKAGGEGLVDELRGVLPGGASVKLAGAESKDIVLLVTKEYHCLADVLARCEFNAINANVKAVIGNHDTLRSYVEKFNIPFHLVSHENCSREEHEAAVTKAINPYKPDYLVLAKYMRILSSEFVSQWQNKIVNIHHSFLPAFIGANPYKQAYKRGVKIIGATAHFVTTDLDDGPIISQSVIPIDHTHGWRDMAQAGRDVEKSVLARALGLVLEDRVFVCGNKTIIFD